MLRIRRRRKGCVYCLYLSLWIDKNTFIIIRMKKKITKKIKEIVPEPEIIEVKKGLFILCFD